MDENIFAWLNRNVLISRETFERFVIYCDLLLKWQSKINLISPNTISEIWERHFLDSLQLVSLIPDRNADIADLGSGAGFPGMVLAIYGYNVHLIESDSKKIAFLKEVARLTKTDVHIHHGRIESLSMENVDIFISRACAPLTGLLQYISPNVSHETICLFHKGKNYSKEIKEAREHWSFEAAMIPSVADKQGAILKLAGIRKRGI